ncbi:MAG: DNA translocase FtsK [Kiritimatiellia bacterium]
MGKNTAERREKTRETDRLEWERLVRRRIIGFFLLPVSIFPLLSIITYNWRDISWLNAPPLNPCVNWIGPVGAWAVFLGYSYIGLALWAVPLFVILLGLLMTAGKLVYVSRKLPWVLLFILSLACMLQLGNDDVLRGVLVENNICHAGGMIGYWMMTCLLTKWISPVGSGILVLCVFIFSFLMVIGTENIFRMLRWCSERIFLVDDENDDSYEGLLNSRREGNFSGNDKTRSNKTDFSDDKEARRREREEKKRLKTAENAEKRRKKAEERALRKEEKLKKRESEKLLKQETEAERIRKLAEKARKDAVAFTRSRNIPPQPSYAVKGSQRRSAPVPDAPSPSARKPVQQNRPSPEDAASGQKTSEPARRKKVDYMLPPIDLLDPIPSDKADHGGVEEMAQLLVTALNHFKIPCKVVGIKPGPVVTQYELEPAPHIRVERICSLSNNLKMSLAASSLRVEAPIPGKKAVGVEIPNKKARSVTFRSIIESSAWQNNEMQIPLAIGKNVSGDDFVYDLTKAPHMLVAGSTGSGKSVCLNAILCGLLMSRTPEQLKLILIDPKRVEFVAYNDLPHLLVPVINDPNKVVFGLKWAVSEMDKRYRLLQKVRARNIFDYNNRPVIQEEDLFEGTVDSESKVPEKLPYIVIVIDEVADIMNVASKEVEPVINRLCALSRAVGIHMIMATQRPSVDVITGTIKANIPGRIAFKVSQANDSRTILDSPGAENLIGSGDMLFLQSGSDLLRAQGAWVNGMEVNRIVSYVKQRHAPVYDEKLSKRLEKIKESDPEDIMKEAEPEAPKPSKADRLQQKREGELEELYKDAIEMIRVHKRVSGELVRRKLKVGYSRANTIIDMLEERGVVSPMDGSNTREILIDLDQPPPGSEYSDEDVSDETADDTDLPSSDAVNQEGLK